jgi:Putative peptidoglycan binding domain/CHAP domain
VLARERALRVALAEARDGVREVSGNTSKRIREYQAADSFVAGPKDTGYAWCNSFVVWCYREARRELTETGRSPSVPTTATLARDAGWVVRKPKRGDVVCFQLPVGGLRPVDKTPDHIGIVVEVNADGSVRTVEGNTVGSSGEGVFVLTRPREECETFIRVPGKVPTGIGRGDRGADVKALQRQLVKLGHKKLVVDGEFGEKTEKAVGTIQRRNGLAETGVITPDTRTAIARALEPSKPVPKGRAAPKRHFRVTATFPEGDTEEVDRLATRAAVSKQINAFLTAGATSVEVSPAP